MKHFLLYAGSSGLTAISHLVMLPVFTQYLSLSDYGAFALFHLFGINFCSIFVFGLNDALSRFYYDKPDHEYDEVFSSILFAKLLFLLASIICFWPMLPIISEMLFGSSLSPSLLKISLLNGFLHCLYISFGHCITAQKRSAYFASVTLAWTFVNVTSVLLLVVLSSWRLEAMIFGSILANLVGAFSMLMGLRRYLTFVVDISVVTRALKYGFPLTPSALVGMLQGSLDRILVREQESTAGVGELELGGKFANVLNLVTVAVGRAWAPIAYEFASTNDQNLLRDLLRTFQGIITFLGVTGLLVIAVIKECFWLLTTDEFHNVYLVSVPLLVSCMLGFANLITGWQIDKAKKTNNYLNISLISCIVTVLFNLILIPHYGVYGAVYSSLLSAVFSAFLLGWYGHKAYPINGTNRFLLIFFSVLLSCVFVIVSINFFPYPWPILFGLKLSIIVFFVALSVSFKWLTTDGILLAFQRLKKGFRF